MSLKNRIFPPGRFFSTLGFDQTPLQLQIDIYWWSESTVFSKRHLRPGPNPANPGNPEHVRFDAVDNTSTGQIEDQTISDPWESEFTDQIEVTKKLIRSNLLRRGSNIVSDPGCGTILIGFRKTHQIEVGVYMVAEYRLF